MTTQRADLRGLAQRLRDAQTAIHEHDEPVRAIGIIGGVINELDALRAHPRVTVDNECPDCEGRGCPECGKQSFNGTAAKPAPHDEEKEEAAKYFEDCMAMDLLMVGIGNGEDGPACGCEDRKYQRLARWKALAAAALRQQQPEPAYPSPPKEQPR